MDSREQIILEQLTSALDHDIPCVREEMTQDEIVPFAFAVKQIDSIEP